MFSFFGWTILTCKYLYEHSTTKRNWNCICTVMLEDHVIRVPHERGGCLLCNTSSVWCCDRPSTSKSILFKTTDLGVTLTPLMINTSLTITPGETKPWLVSAELFLLVLSAPVQLSINYPPPNFSENTTSHVQSVSVIRKILRKNFLQCLQYLMLLIDVFKTFWFKTFLGLNLWNSDFAETLKGECIICDPATKQS